MISGERFLAIYRLTGSEKEAWAKAQDLCLEETVEFPEELIPPGMIRDHVFGRIEEFAPYPDITDDGNQGSGSKKIGDLARLVLAGDINQPPSHQLESLNRRS